MRKIKNPHRMVISFPGKYKAALLRHWWKYCEEHMYEPHLKVVEIMKEESGFNGQGIEEDFSSS